jgi:hypothetical protein
VILQQLLQIKRMLLAHALRPLLHQRSPAWSSICC